MSKVSDKNKSGSKTKTSTTKQRGLGRGLSALMNDIQIAPPVVSGPAISEDSGPKTDTAQTPDTENQDGLDKELMADSESKDVSHVRGGASQSRAVLPIHLLERNPDQPRRYFDPEKLKELVQSIADKGILQPILVRPLPIRGDKEQQHYQIVAGERRWHAAQKAGLTSMPALIRDLSDQEVLEIGVVENIQRADLNPVEEARAYKALVDQFSRSQEEIAKAIGKSRVHITNMLRLLTLPERAQELLAQGKISTGHARAIISAPDPIMLAEDIVAKGLSVRAAEDWVRRIKSGKNTGAKLPDIKDADTRKIEEALISALGLHVDLRHKSPGGEIRIRYKTIEQLDDLIRKLKTH